MIYGFAYSLAQWNHLCLDYHSLASALFWDAVHQQADCEDSFKHIVRRKFSLRLG